MTKTTPHRSSIPAHPPVPFTGNQHTTGRRPATSLAGRRYRAASGDRLALHLAFPFLLCLLGSFGGLARWAGLPHAHAEGTHQSASASPSALLIAAQQKVASKDYWSALALLETVGRAGERQPDYWLVLASARAGVGDYESSLKALAALSEAHPELSPLSREVGEAIGCVDWAEVQTLGLAPTAEEFRRFVKDHSHNRFLSEVLSARRNLLLKNATDPEEIRALIVQLDGSSFGARASVALTRLDRLQRARFDRLKDGISIPKFSWNYLHSLYSMGEYYSLERRGTTTSASWVPQTTVRRLDAVAGTFTVCNSAPARLKVHVEVDVWWSQNWKRDFELEQGCIDVQFKHEYNGLAFSKSRPDPVVRFWVLGELPSRKETP